MKKSLLVKIGLGVVGVILVLVLIGSCAAKRLEKQKQEEPRQSQETPASSTTTAELSDYDREQLRLIKKFGSAGDGFRWSDDGKKVALGDPNLTETQVIYTFIRSLSTLDFATAQRYSFKDKVTKSIDHFFSTDADTGYSATFTKNMYQQVLLSIEPLKINSTASFASGKVNISMTLNLLDLSYKDFWKEDEEYIFEQLETYKRSEVDNTKARIFLYDYVQNYWTSEDALKKEVTLNFVLEQSKDGGYLVTVSDELDNYARYLDGESVVDAIARSYERSVN